MTTKRRDRAGPAENVEHVRLIERWERATEQLELLALQRSLCEWIDTAAVGLALFDQEMRAIGALARDHDQAHAELMKVERTIPQMVATAKAVFAVLHFADREAPLLEELDAATRLRDDARKLLDEAELRLREAQPLSEGLATRRSWSLRRQPDRAHDQWVLIQRLTPEVKERRAAFVEAKAGLQPLAAEYSILEREMDRFRRDHGNSPAEIYARVEEHRRTLRKAKAAYVSRGDSVTRRRLFLEGELRIRLGQAQKWGLVSHIPEGAEAMVDAIEQSREVAMLETSRVDCSEIDAQVESSARKVVALARRLEVDAPGPSAKG